MHSLELHKKELLRKFIEQSISESERHELERLALDDPFLFEALEGYAIDGGVTTQARVIEAANALVPQEKKEKRIGFRFTQLASIAAGLLFVAVMGFVIRQNIVGKENYNIQVVDAVEEDADGFEESIAEVIELPNEISTYVEDEAEKDISVRSTEGKALRVEKLKVAPVPEQIITKAKEVKKESPAAPPIIAGNESSVVIDGVPNLNAPVTPEQISEEIAEVVIVTKKSPVRRESKSNLSDLKEKKLEQSSNVAAVKEKMEKETEALQDFDVEAESTSSDDNYTTISKRKSSSAGIQSYSENNRRITGQVLDDSGVPLIGANVMVKGTKIGAVTDIDGSFTLDVPNDVNSIEISYVGYGSQIAMLNDASEYKIRMEESGLLDEVVVRSYGSRNAEPVIGFEQFEEYIYDNNAMEDCNISRTITFEVDNSGSLKNVRVEDGNYDECTNEAIRLLKNSGAWKSIPPNRTVTTQYTVRLRR